MKLQAAIVDDCFHPPNTEEELIGTIMDPSTRYKDPYSTGVSNLKPMTKEHVLHPTLKEEHPPWLKIQIYQYL